MALDMGQVWDSVVESALQRQNSQPSNVRRSGLRLTLDPRPIALPDQPRTIALIPEMVRKSIRAVVQGDSPWPLVLYGPPGTGKTCAGLCLLDHAGGMYHTVSGLCQRLIDAQQGRLSWQYEGRGGDVTTAMVWKQILDAPLVVLDELGARERVSDHQYETVKGVVDCRNGDPLMCISNLGPEKLAVLYDDRILDRLAAGTLVHVTGPSQRVGV